MRQQPTSYSASIDRRRRWRIDDVVVVVRLWRLKFSVVNNSSSVESGVGASDDERCAIARVDRDPAQVRALLRQLVCIQNKNLSWANDESQARNSRYVHPVCVLRCTMISARQCSTIAVARLSYEREQIELEQPASHPNNDRTSFVVMSCECVGDAMRRYCTRASSRW